MHHFHLTYLLKKEINEIYIMNSLHTFAISSVGIFVPIFLLNRGFSLLLVLLYLGLNAFSVSECPMQDCDTLLCMVSGIPSSSVSP
ncbi:MAG: hypothetical protein ACQESG_01710 [Nanobdellota archaeon]